MFLPSLLSFSSVYRNEGHWPPFTLYQRVKSNIVVDRNFIMYVYDVQLSFDEYPNAYAGSKCSISRPSQDHFPLTLSSPPPLPSTPHLFKFCTSILSHCHCFAFPLSFACSHRLRVFFFPHQCLHSSTPILCRSPALPSALSIIGLTVFWWLHPSSSFRTTIHHPPTVVCINFSFSSVFLVIHFITFILRCLHHSSSSVEPSCMPCFRCRIYSLNQKKILAHQSSNNSPLQGALKASLLLSSTLYFGTPLQCSPHFSSNIHPLLLVSSSSNQSSTPCLSRWWTIAPLFSLLFFLQLFLLKKRGLQGYLLPRRLEERIP